MDQRGEGKKAAFLPFMKKGGKKKKGKRNPLIPPHRKRSPNFFVGKETSPLRSLAEGK